MNERKNIIISLKSSLGEQKKGIKKRLLSLKGIFFLNIILTLISAGVIAVSIISELFNYEIIEWKKIWTLSSIEFFLCVKSTESIF